MILRLVKSEFIKNTSIIKSLFIIIILLISSLVLIKIEENKTNYMEHYFYTKDDYNYSLKKAKESLLNNPNTYKKDILNILEDLKETRDIIEQNIGNNPQDMWQKNTFDMLILDVCRKYAYKTRLNKAINDNNELIDLENSIIQEVSLYNTVKVNYRTSLEEYVEDLNESINTINKYINQTKLALARNEYYLMMKVDCERQDLYNEPNKRNEEICKYVIDKKIKSREDYRLINAINYAAIYDQINNYKNIKRDVMESKDAFEYRKKFSINMNKILSKQDIVLSYAYKNELKHDLSFPSQLTSIGNYKTSKTYMNLGLSLGIIVLILLIITNSGIISQEHEKGTMKLLLTAPIKREKILLSKFIYLLLDMYLIWIIGLIIMFIIVGINYGLTDLFTNKIIVFMNKPVEINYFIYYFKDLLICSIPIIGMISLMLFFSTIIKNAIVTSTIMTIITILSCNIWTSVGRLSPLFYLIYTPFPYLNYNMIISNNVIYISSISNTNLTPTYGIILNILITIFFLITSINIFRKQDIINK